MEDNKFMDKRTEIRKGIAIILKSVHRSPASEGWELNILEYLHSQGAVLKVKRELPSVFDNNEDCISAIEYRKKLAGYGFFEPLIEEEK